MKTATLRAALLVGALASPAAASSVGLIYNTPNGGGTASGGTVNYWDVIYSAPGAPVTIDGAPLTFGRGKLTDGVTTTANWDTVSNIAGTGPHVGWRDGFQTNPTVEFFWPIPVVLCPGVGCFLVQDLLSVTVWMDNSGTGGVFAPSAILLDGTPLAFSAPALGTSGPVTIDLRPLGLTGFDPALQFIQAGPGDWVFVSEVEWEVRQRLIGVPAPGAAALLGAGLLGLAGLRRARLNLRRRPA